MVVVTLVCDGGGSVADLQITIPASWVAKRRPCRRVVEAALKRWELTDCAAADYVLRRSCGTAVAQDADVSQLADGETLRVAAAERALAQEAASAAPKGARAEEAASSATAPLGGGDARVPLCGLGTGGVPGLEGDVCVDVVRHALRSGVRLIDTASQYRNEREIGRALRLSGVPRAEVFLVTKIAPLDHGFQKATASIVSSLEKLGVDFLDLVLVHWPGAWVREQSDWDARRWLQTGPDSAPALARRLRRETWRAMESAQSSGLVRHVGVSNYTVAHLDELLTYATAPPAVVQSEMSVLYGNRAVVEWCGRHGVHFQAYGPFGGGSAAALAHPEVVRVAKAVGRTPAQVALRALTHRGISVLPKSSKGARAVENARLDFDLSAADRAALDAAADDRPRYWDPATVDKVDIFNPFFDKDRVQRELAAAGY